jgi:hypothetical protein
MRRASLDAPRHRLHVRAGEPSPKSIQMVRFIRRAEPQINPWYALFGEPSPKLHGSCHSSPKPVPASRTPNQSMVRFILRAEPQSLLHRRLHAALARWIVAWGLRRGLWIVACVGGRLGLGALCNCGGGGLSVHVSLARAFVGEMA